MNNNKHENIKDQKWYTDVLLEQMNEEIERIASMIIKRYPGDPPLKIFGTNQNDSNPKPRKRRRKKKK